MTALAAPLIVSEPARVTVIVFVAEQAPNSSTITRGCPD